MRSCLVLGSGRSGTSLLAGTLSKAGYYMGDAPVGAGPANPKGFFEDYKINWINEELLRPHTLERFQYGWRWLAPVSVGAMGEYPINAEVLEALIRHVSHAPFCFKDPRFCYTLPLWRFHMKDAAFLCVFREPARTVESILTECRTAEYLCGIDMDFDAALEVWTLMYRHILEIHRHKDDWLFFHYDQILDGSAFPRLDRLLGATVNREFRDPSLARTKTEREVSPAAATVYERLCELAAFRPQTAAIAR